jgi:hypothetical protein
LQRKARYGAPRLRVGPGFAILALSVHAVTIDLIFFLPATCGMIAVAAWIAYFFRSFGNGSDDGNDGGQRVPVPEPTDPSSPDGPRGIASSDLARSA